MSKIIYLMGKSSTGKDTVFKRLLERKDLALRTIVPYTTRPCRVGEQDGVEYFFKSEEEFRQLLAQGKIIEYRSYDTFHGLWRYFTVDDGQIFSAEKNCAMIGTPEGYLKMRNYFGQDRLLPILIDLDDGERLQRALSRERSQEQPKYEEMCRRFLADAKDFADEKIREIGVDRRFYNENLEECIAEIADYIKNSCK